MKLNASEPITFFLFAYWHDPFWKQFVGPSVKLWDLATNLYHQGHHVVMFLPKYGFKQLQVPFELIEIPIINVPFFRAFSYNFFLILYLLSGRPRIRPDVVYLRRTLTVVPMIYAKLIRALFFYEVNDDPYYDRIGDVKSIESVIRGRLAIVIDELNFKFADRIFVISKPIIEKILDNNPSILNNKLVLMPSGANTDIFYSMDRITVLTALGLDKTKQYVGFVGTFLAHQGVDTLINGATSVLKHHPECRFVIIGEGPMKDKWKEMIGQAGLENAFMFTGQIFYHELAKWINAMDVCMAPYLTSAGYRSPVKIFDYMACARPVVASRIVGTTDIFEDSNALALIPPEDPHALASAVMELLSNEEKATAMGRSGRMLVERLYSRRKIAQSVQDEARRLLNIGTDSTGFSV
jgi:glycosyltransferase involved in cell wall biosynthesis